MPIRQIFKTAFWVVVSLLFVPWHRVGKAVSLSAPDNAADENALSIYLAEYNSLRSEMMQRVESQNQSFNFLLIIIGAAVTAVVSIQTAAHHPAMPFVILAVALFLPIATCPLGFAFFDNEIMIHAIGSSLFYDGRRHFEDIAKDKDVFANILLFRHLPPSTQWIFPKISRGRWVLFCLPTFPSLVAAVLSMHQLAPYLWGHKAVLGLAIVVLVADAWACRDLAQAMWWVFDNGKFQKQKYREYERLRDASAGRSVFRKDWSRE